MNPMNVPSVDETRRRLEGVGQSHVLRFVDELDESGRRRLLEQIAGIEVERVPRLVEQYVHQRGSFGLPVGLEPAPYYGLETSAGTGGTPIPPKTGTGGTLIPLQSPSQNERSRGGRDGRDAHTTETGSHSVRGSETWDRARFRAKGEDLLRAGKVAAFTVAGGQGTRLGFDGPKGTYPGTAVTKKPLFRCLAEWVLAGRRRFGRAIPWYVMTSPLNHADTVGFFRRHAFFGLDEREVMFFSQGVLPSLDMETGRLILAAKGEVATNPDGHGGSLRALWTSGAIEDMRRRGVEHLSYVQIDNPLARVIDPVFIGLHAAGPDSSAEMSSKMVAKTDAAEKVGVFCKGEGKTRVIEYSDLPKEKMEERGAGGRLRFNAGSIAVHMIGVEFVARLNAGGELRLPLHRAEKKVPYFDVATGRVVQPERPNAVKLEAFVFDALPLCRDSIVMEADRTDEFAPIKNSEGADSPATCRDIQTARAARWLEACGVKVPRRGDGSADCVIEISPLTAWGPEDLREASLPGEIARGAAVAM